MRALTFPALPRSTMTRVFFSRSSFLTKFGWWFIWSLLLLTVSAPVRADEASPTELAVARRLFREATELEADRRWDQAALKLREAIRIKDTPGLRFHLAHCQENMGLLVEALLDYDRARDLIAAGARADDVEALLPAAQRSLARRVPSIVIVPPPGVKQASAAIDGQPLAPSVLGRPAPVNPGIHQVRVSAPGYRDFLVSVTVTEGERRVLNVKLAPDSRGGAAATGDGPAPSDEERESGPSARTYVLVGEVAVTAASLALGVTFMIVGSRADDRVQRANSSVDTAAQRNMVSPRCDTATGDVLEACRYLADAYEDRNRYEVLSTVGFVGAGVGAVATAMTYLLWRDEPPKVGIVGGASPGSLWLGAGGRF